jgi:hypothetical protein
MVTEVTGYMAGWIVKRLLDQQVFHNDIIENS